MTIKMKCPLRRSSACCMETRKLIKAMIKLKPDQAVIVDSVQQRQVYRIAERHGFKVVTRKINGKGIGVWRVQ